jgi:hypothetical protein
MQSICVYCGSNFGARPDYRKAAVRLGTVLAKNGQRLIYGGGKIGLMGVIADAVLSAGGEVVGVIPEALVAKELAHAGLTKLHVVDSMHTRKALMAELADGFVALPGGLGTLDELFEICTWSQLGLHQKPIGLLNVRGFYDPLVAFLDELVREKFVRAENRAGLAVAANPEVLLRRMSRIKPIYPPKWITSAET